MLPALFITILIEGIIAAIYSFHQKKPAGWIFFTSLTGNLLTQSLLWIALNLFPTHYLFTLLSAEILIWLTESALLHSIPFNRLAWREALSLSLLMNLSSFGVGWFLPV